MIMGHLNPFLKGIANRSSLPSQGLALVPPTQPLPSGTQQTVLAQQTPRHPPLNILASPYKPPVSASQPHEPESQIPFHRSPSPPPGEDSNNATQSQGFLETQYTPEEEAAQATPNLPCDTMSGISVDVPKTTTTTSLSHHDKKRKLDTDDNPTVNRSSNEEPSPSNQSAKFVSDLLDFSEDQTESSGSLGITHPPLDPYEGTPWVALDRFSVSGPSNRMLCI